MLATTSQNARCLLGQRRAAACGKAVHQRAAPVRANSVATKEATTDGLVLSRGEAGSWDDAGVGSPVVRCYLGDNEERWVMWYSGRDAGVPATESMDAVAPSSGAAGVAISSNGVDWLRGGGRVTGERGEGAASDVGMIMEPNKDWWWFDTCHMQVSDVQILSNSSVDAGVGVFWMFYSGGDFNPVAAPTNFPGLDAGAQEGFRLRPGLAMSQDGRNWARIESDHHTGALFDVGEPGEWDELYIGTPQVMAAGPRDMRLFYHSFDASKGRFVIGVATSPDGFKWTKKGVVFDPVEAGAGPAAHDAMGAASFHVARDVDNRQYVLFYEAVAADNRRSIGLAVSKEGMTGWQRCPSAVLDAAGAGASSEQGGSSPASDAWDAGSVGQPCSVSMSKGAWRLYYAGRKSPASGAFEGIGLALSVEGGPMFQGMPALFKRRAASK